VLAEGVFAGPVNVTEMLSLNTLVIVIAAGLSLDRLRQGSDVVGPRMASADRRAIGVPAAGLSAAAPGRHT
jgi:hypothetical protein